MGEICLFLAALVRGLPGTGMGFSMRKLWSPHLGVAKLSGKHPTFVLLCISLLWASTGSLRCSSPWTHRSP